MILTKFLRLDAPSEPFHTIAACPGKGAQQQSFRRLPAIFRVASQGVEYLSILRRSGD